MDNEVFLGSLVLHCYDNVLESNSDVSRPLVRVFLTFFIVIYIVVHQILFRHFSPKCRSFVLDIVGWWCVTDLDIYEVSRTATNNFAHLLTSMIEYWFKIQSPAGRSFVRPFLMINK
jgi:hypothetical protein